MLVAVGCGATSLEPLRGSQSVDELRRFIADNPNDPEVTEARQRIAELEYKAAVAQNTRYGYTMFLERHAESRRALDSRKRLEELDFKTAKEAADERPLELFLERYPGGPFSPEAARRLDSARCARAARLEDLDELRAFLRVCPRCSCAAPLEARLDERTLERAIAERSIDRLCGLGERTPAIAERAQKALLALEVEVLADAFELERARAVLSAQAPAREFEALDRMLAVREQAFSQAAFLADPSPSGLAAKLRAATQRLLPDAHERLTVPAGARERWLFARTLATAPSEEAAGLALGLLSDPFLRVRREALVSLEGILGALGPARSRLWLCRERARLQKTAQSGPPLLALAVIRAHQDDLPGALLCLEQHEQRSESPDLLALALAVQLHVRREEFRSGASLASRFSDAAQEFFGQRRLACEGLPQAEEAWLSLFQVGGLLDLWQEVLAPFRMAEAHAPSELLGNWQQAVEADLAKAQRWLADEKSRFLRLHPEIELEAPAEAAPRDLGGAIQDLFSLAVLGGTTAAPSLVRVATSDALPLVRSAAAQVGLHAAIRRAVTPLWFGLDPR